MKTHNSSDALSCGLSKAVQNGSFYIYYIWKMQCFRTKISIPVTPLAQDVTSASKLRLSHFGSILKDQEITF